MTEISIIIVTWNSAVFINKCLRSLYLRSNASKSEVLVIDNGSQDGTAELVKEEFANVIIIQNKENIGFSRAANLGISKSKGKYIFLLNPDTRFESDVAGTLAVFLETHMEAAAVGPAIYNPDGTVALFSARELPSLQNMAFRQFGLRKIFPDHKLIGRETIAGWDRKSVRQVAYLNGSAIMIRREIFNRYGLLDETLPMYFEDLELSARLSRCKQKLFVVPEAVLTHFGNRSAVQSPSRRILIAMEDGEAPWLYFRQYKSGFQAVLFKCLVFSGSVGRLTTYILRNVFTSWAHFQMSENKENSLRSQVLLKWALLSSAKFRRLVQWQFPNSC